VRCRDRPELQAGPACPVYFDDVELRAVSSVN
jgi:hypothetical protein